MLLVLFSAFAALCGVVEAVLYSRRGAEAFSRNEHVEMTGQRLAALLLVPAGIFTYQLCSAWAYVGGEMLAAVLCFPLVHDECYNFTRLWIREREALEQAHPVVKGLTRALFGTLDGYALQRAAAEYRYGYQSATTTARNDFTGTQRTLLAAAGLVVEVVALLLVCYG